MNYLGIDFETKLNHEGIVSNRSAFVFSMKINGKKVFYLRSIEKEDIKNSSYPCYLIGDIEPQNKVYMSDVEETKYILDDKQLKFIGSIRPYVNSNHVGFEGIQCNDLIIRPLVKALIFAYKKYCNN